MASINAGLALDWQTPTHAIEAAGQLAKIVEAEITGFFPLSRNGRSGSSIADASALIADLGGADSTQYIYQGGGKLKSDFSISRSGRMFEIQAVCEIGLGKIGSNLVAAYADLLERLCKDNVKVSGICALGIRGLKIKRIRPSRQFGSIDIDSLVDLFTTELDQGLAGKMQELKLPVTAKRTRIGSSTIVNWSPGLAMEDIPSVRSILEEKQRWLSENLGAPLADGWNRDGDSEFQLGAARPVTGLTLYDPSIAAGFVSIHSAEAAKDQDRKIAALSQMLSTGHLAGSDLALDDGGIIASDRETAVRLHDRFSKSQIRWFLYSTENTLFNPFPEGTWQQP